MSGLGWIDGLVLVAALGSAVWIGVRGTARGRTLEAYLVGDRDLPWWAILGSIVATETSAATVLSVPGKALGPTGLKFLQLALGLLLGKLIVAGWLLPLFCSGRLVSAYELLGTRFGPRTQRLASGVFLVTRNFGDGLRLYLAALVLQQLVGWPIGLSALCIGAVTIVYTFLGGIRSVVWNDCVQLLIYLAGGVATLLVIGGQVPGGWPAVVDFARESGTLQVFQFGSGWSDPDNFWVGLIGGAFLSLGTHGADQMMVQRYVSARGLPAARRALILSGFVVCLQFALFLWIGLGLAYFFAHSASRFDKPDAAYIAFVLHEFPQNTGLIGLMLAAIMAATMSTLSSSLNSSATVWITDLLPRGTNQNRRTDAFAAARRMTVVFGVVQIAIGIWASRWNAAVIDSVLTIAGFAFGILLGLFALGTLTRRTGEPAALVGAGLGLAVLLLIRFAGPLVGWQVPGYWFAAIGALVTFAAGWSGQRLLFRQGNMLRSQM